MTGAGLATAYFRWHQPEATTPRSSPGWNSSAIEARFRNTIVMRKADPTRTEFFYTIRNNTVSDYTLNAESSPALFLVGPRNEILAIPEDISKNFELLLPLFIPANREVIYSIVSVNDVSSDGIVRLRGFEIFDRKSRYAIFLPKGR
jgi:hypothetical protein